ncbi:MAG: MarR family transcriptional regulator [Micrococcaceae bacterium]|jgi:DNA-binding MarR family transcriptional regulator|uniref:MarR family transcriptional regulator n=1 Tax=Arthrobacter cheniae TaxID=1258888 RepID=A0A3A5M8I5_9MICC|nr:MULTISPECIES: MarR family transcriptional regulator [Arthrobacter]MCU1633135.1 MarR family transcriptional regulator [Micrococcaceae bacterium]MEC5199542.1 DNA-binding MarR family transcriptional regulator [Arthrobacter sp. PL16]RJT77834.1 MarR family transcriptional regulator [Arthrobacter cheniae]
MSELEEWSTSRLLTTAARLVDHAWNERLLNIGITHAGYTTLGVLSREGTMTGAKLALAVHVQAQTIGKTIEKLERQGFISRIRDSIDRRSQRITISPAGTHALAQAEDIERTLMVGEGLESFELRSLLHGIVGELAPQRQKPTAAIV